MKKCSFCGKEYPDDAIACEVDQSPLDGMQPEIIPHQDKSPSAGFAIRALARIIDTLFGLVIGFVAGIVAVLAIIILHRVGIVPTGWQHRLHGLSLESFSLGILGNTAYHFFCEGVHGSTLGKLCCGLRVVSEDGSPSNFKGALFRTLAFYVDSFFFGLVGYNSMKESPLNQRYGDVWGKTAVFKTNEMTPGYRRTSIHFVLGLLLGAGCWLFMEILGLILQVL